MPENTTFANTTQPTHLNGKSNRVFRSQPVEHLDDSRVHKMLAQKGFLDERPKKETRGARHVRVVTKKAVNEVVFDHVTNLTWQQNGSPKYMMFLNAESYINQLNSGRHYGFDDWRLPTLEEAMTLLEIRKNTSGLYIDSVFDNSQCAIWTSDKNTASFAWAVNFFQGSCNQFLISYDSLYVRAVR